MAVAPSAESQENENGLARKRGQGTAGAVQDPQAMRKSPPVPQLDPWRERRFL
jgi:hypothetical protein